MNMENLGSLRIERFDGDGSRWDEFVASAEGSTFCHLYGWREIMEDVLGHECYYNVALDSAGGWRGVLPLVHVRSRLFGDYLLSMPFLNYGGPLGAEAAKASLVENAVDTARRLGVDLLELRTRRAVPGDLRTSKRKITVLLDLPESAETLWKDVFKSKLRSQIRRPQKDGLEARFGLEEREPFYEVFARNMRDLGTPVLPEQLFERIERIFANQALFGVVYSGEVPVASGCGFRWGEEFELSWASSLREYNRQAPNMLLYWSYMSRCIEDGMRIFNFGRCTEGSGTHRFKRQWGGRDVELPWTQWTQAEVEATPSPDTPLFRLATAAWGRMPLPLANRIGPFLARQLP